MKYCSKCGAEGAEEDLFCMICGTKFEILPQSKDSFQEQSQTQDILPVQMNASVVQAQPVQVPQPEPAVLQSREEAEVPAVPAAEAPAVSAKSAGNSKFPMKYLGIGAGIIAAIAAVILIIVLLPSGGSRGQNAALYIKDGELMYNDLSQKESLQVTKRLASEWDNETFNLHSYMISDAVRFSSDGKYIFYPDKTNGNIMGYTLYYRKLNDKDGEAVKIDSDISRYILTQNSDNVVYLKNGTLYIHDLKEKTKIASEVGQYYVSDDGKTLYWMSDEKIYRKKGNEDNEKIDSNVSQICDVTSDFSTIFYLKDDNLYKKSVNEEKEKIASDVSDFILNDDNGVYYTVRPDEEEGNDFSFAINDDMKVVDEQTVAKGYPEYPWDASEEEYAEYERTCAEYNAAVLRNELRDAMYYYVNSSGSGQYKLWYFDGKENTCVLENFNISTCYFIGDSKEYGIIFSTREENGSRPKMSDLYNRHFSDGRYEYSEFFEDLNDSTKSEQSWVLIRGKEFYSVEFSEDAEIVACSAEDNKVLYMTEMDSKGNGELWMAEIGKDSVAEKKIIADDVSRSSVCMNEDGKAVYFTDLDSDYTGTLNIDGKAVADDVYAFSMTMHDNGNLLFYTDYNTKKRCGTLMLYDGSKAKVIKEDVSDYQALPDGSILFLYDFSTKHSTGELYIWDGKEKKIDEDVSAIIYQ